jgi:hypothetical protein
MVKEHRTMSRYIRGRYPWDIKKSRRLSSLRTILRHTHEPGLRRTLEREMKKARRGSRSPIRGWAANAPQQGRPRDQVMRRCGKKCFLDPKRKDFPICRKCYGDDCDCRASCRGIRAAKIRAKQFGYRNIADKAQRLEDHFKCQDADESRRWESRGYRMSHKRRNRKGSRVKMSVGKLLKNIERRNGVSRRAAVKRVNRADARLVKKSRRSRRSGVKKSRRSRRSGVKKSRRSRRSGVKKSRRSRRSGVKMSLKGLMKSLRRNGLSRRTAVKRVNREDARLSRR